jgi:hypothetical protein
MQKHEWAVVGSGISGLVSSEILTREGHSTVLIEKNEKLASETTRDFHEWMHSGSLYTLIPDNLLTLKFILGAIDDLLEYYNSFDNMNLIPTESGLNIKEKSNGWFNQNFIHFKYRIKDRKLTFPWLIGIARSIFLIEKIKKHDWLRRRAGVTDPFKMKYKEILQIIYLLIKNKEIFYNYRTSDFTLNSRIILNDLLNNSISNGLNISTSNEFINYKVVNNKIIVNCSKENFEVDKILLCISGNIAKYTDSSMKISYAPLAVINNIKPETQSFVELDYYPKNCINIITKEDSIGLIGGISFSDINKCETYINQVINKHKIYNPDLNVLHKYNGIKSEITFKGQPRNYQYHILELEKNVWGIIPGKFTLGFSIAPEFYRRVYKKNPRKHFNQNENISNTNLVSNTVWYDVFKQKQINEV